MAPATESGIRVNGLVYKSLFIIACVYALKTLITFNHSVAMGNDCSEQQQKLVDLQNFRTNALRTSRKMNEESATTVRNLNELLSSKNDQISQLEQEITKLKEQNQAQKEANDSLKSTPAQQTQDSLLDDLQKIQSARTELPKLSDLTRQSENPQCNEGKIYKKDIVVAEGELRNLSSEWNKIPKLIHQTSRFRCLTEAFNISTTKWSSWSDHGWSYYFHDDEAMQRMFEMNYDVFPMLKDVVENCLVSGTAKADLWRYLVLWHYGGIYSDLDTTPHNLSPDTFDAIATKEKPLEAFFIIEAFHFLSQYFFAIAPRHPLMYHTIMSTVHKLLNVPDTSAFDASLITGPKALHQGFVHYVADAGVIPEGGRKGFGKEFRHKVILTNATIVGTDNSTIASYGHSKDADFWVWRYDKDVSRRHKSGGYAAMGMEHFGKFKARESGISCLQAIKNKHHRPDVSTRFLKSKD